MARRQKELDEDSQERRKRLQREEHNDWQWGEIARLRGLSVPLHELVRTHIFVVDSVLAENNGFCFGRDYELCDPNRQIPYDDKFYYYYSGPLTTLGVGATRERSPVATLRFLGHSSARVGDYVRVKMPVLKAKMQHDPTGVKQTFYFPRDDLSEEELAIELEILAEGRKERRAVRTERSLDYDIYRKPKEE